MVVAIIVSFFFGCILTSATIGATIYFNFSGRLDESEQIIDNANSELEKSKDTNAELKRQLDLTQQSLRELASSIRSSGQLTGELNDTIRQSEKLNDDIRKILDKYDKTK